MYYVYVLYSRSQNKFYIGFTQNLEQRVRTHIKIGNYTTKRLNNLELAYYEACESEKDARVRERQLKTGFGRSYLRRRLKNYLSTICES